MLYIKVVLLSYDDDNTFNFNTNMSKWYQMNVFEEGKFYFFVCSTSGFLILGFIFFLGDSHNMEPFVFCLLE